MMTRFFLYCVLFFLYDPLTTSLPGLKKSIIHGAIEQKNTPTLQLFKSSYNLGIIFKKIDDFERVPHLNSLCSFSPKNLTGQARVQGFKDSSEMH
jgi:hypothetical protein